MHGGLPRRSATAVCHGVHDRLQGYGGLPRRYARYGGLGSAVTASEAEYGHVEAYTGNGLGGGLA
jgi:hypothetical protein